MDEKSDVKDRLASALVRAELRKSIFALRKIGIEPIAQRLGELKQAGAMTDEVVAELLGALIGAYDLLTKTLARLGASERDLEIATGCLATVGTIGLNAKDIEGFRQAQREISRLRAAHARAVAMSRTLPAATVDLIIAEAMKVAESERGPRAKIKIAERALERVNAGLADEGRRQKLKAPRYKDAESLSRAFDQRQKRNS